MSWDSMDNAERDHDRAVDGDAAARTADPCTPLAGEIAALEDQIGLLEEGLPRAPGMERAALFKEVEAYRRELDARRRALRRCRDTSTAQQHQ